MYVAYILAYGSTPCTFYVQTPCRYPTQLVGFQENSFILAADTLVSKNRFSLHYHCSHSLLVDLGRLCSLLLFLFSPSYVRSLLLIVDCRNFPCRDGEQECRAVFPMPGSAVSVTVLFHSISYLFRCCLCIVSMYRIVGDIVVRMCYY